MRILIVGFYMEETMGWYLESNLRKMGHAVSVFCYRSFSQGIHPEAIHSKIARHVYPLNKGYVWKMNRDLMKKVAIFKPELVMVLKGETVLPKTIRSIRQEGIKVINWFMDPIITLAEGLLFDSIPEYEHFLVKDKFIARRLTEIGFDNVGFLLECYDPSIYKKIELSADEKGRYGSEICLVGNIYPYRLRLINNLSGHRFRAWGKLVNVKRSEVEGFYQGRPAVTSEKAKIFNAAKICFNSHNPWEIEGVNVRMFEICGCGTFQLTDGTLHSEKVFRDRKEVAYYRDRKELKELAEYYLINEEERKKISEAGYKRALTEHTYEKRIAELFRIIGV